jgi:chromosome segregation ATPase
MTAEPVNPLIAARRNDSNRRRQKVVDALDRLHTSGEHITVSAVARTAGVDRSFLYRHDDLRSQILAAADQPEPPSSSSTRTSHRSLQADLANLRAHNERLRHQVTKLSERLSEVLGEQVFDDAGLSRTDEIGSLRQRVAELEQQLLDRRQDLQDRDDELAAARATNRDLIATLNRRPQPSPTNSDKPQPEAAGG